MQMETRSVFRPKKLMGFMRWCNRVWLPIGLFLVSSLAFGLKPGCAADQDSTDWAQWLGPNRNGVSDETGLLRSWPDAGPGVLWRIRGGEGFSGISISQGLAYTMYGRGDDEFVVCLNASTGDEVWRFRSDSNLFEPQGGNGPRSTPAVDGDRVFVLSANGKLYGLNARTGAKLWEHDFVKRFGSRRPRWGFCSSPLVEGDLVMIEAGGTRGNSLLAFDKANGRLVWSSQRDKPGYSSPVAITAGGVRQVLFFTAGGLVSVSPKDGRPFWRYAWSTSYDVNAATPIFIPPDKVFISSGYGTGAAVLQIKEAGAGIRVAQVWKNREMKNHFPSSVLNGNYLYGFDNAILKCIDARTGEAVWRHRGFGKGTAIFADGHLIVLGEQGNLGLVEATPSGIHVKAEARAMNGRCWTVPALAGGRLYVRNEKEIACLDLKGRGGSQSEK